MLAVSLHVTVIVAVPVALHVIVPSSATVITLSSDDDHVYVSVSITAGSARVSVNNVCVSSVVNSSASTLVVIAIPDTTTSTVS